MSDQQYQPDKSGDTLANPDDESGTSGAGASGNTGAPAAGQETAGSGVDYGALGERGMAGLGGSKGGSYGTVSGGGGYGTGGSGL